VFAAISFNYSLLSQTHLICCLAHLFFMLRDFLRRPLPFLPRPFPRLIFRPDTFDFLPYFFLPFVLRPVIPPRIFYLRVLPRLFSRVNPFHFLERLYLFFILRPRFFLALFECLRPRFLFFLSFFVRIRRRSFLLFPDFGGTFN